MSDAVTFVEQVRDQVKFNWDAINSHPHQTAYELSGTHPDYPNIHARVLQGVHNDENYVECHLYLTSGCDEGALSKCEPTPDQMLTLTSDPHDRAAVSGFLYEYATPVAENLITRLQAAGRPDDVLLVQAALAEAKAYAGL